MPRRSAARHAAPRRGALRGTGADGSAGRPSSQYAPLAAPGPAADPVPFRGTGRPSFLTYATAAALLTTAGLVAGVTAGPTAAAGAIGAHGLTSDARGGGAAASDYAAPFGNSAASRRAGQAGRSSAAAGLAYLFPSQSAAQRPDGTAQSGGAGAAARTRTGRRSGAAGRTGPATRTGAARQPRSEPSASPSPSAAPQQPIEIYDSTTPSALPAGVMSATYATGHFAVPAADMAGRPTIWIDAWGTDPAASVLDVEPGDVTPSMVPQWVTKHLALEPTDNARIYTMLNEWPAVQQATSTLPSWMQARIRWWIADPTGVAHMVPGASATQWYWGPSYDISTAEPGF